MIPFTPCGRLLTNPIRAVFHRATAHTERAGPEDIDMLSHRLIQGAQRPELQLALRCHAIPLKRLRFEQAQVEDWLRRREAYVRANSGKPANRPVPQEEPGGVRPGFAHPVENTASQVRYGSGIPPSVSHTIHGSRPSSPVTNSVIRSFQDSSSSGATCRCPLRVT